MHTLVVVGSPQWQPVALQASITQIGNENSIENQAKVLCKKHSQLVFLIRLIHQAASTVHTAASQQQ